MTEQIINPQNPTVVEVICKALKERKSKIAELESAVSTTEKHAISAAVISSVLNSYCNAEEIPGLSVSSYLGHPLIYVSDYPYKDDTRVYDDIDCIGDNGKYYYYHKSLSLNNGIISKDSLMGLSGIVTACKILDVVGYDTLVSEARKASNTDYYLSVEQQDYIRAYVPNGLDARSIELSLRACNGDNPAFNDSEKSALLEKYAVKIFESMKKEGIINCKRARVLSSIVSILKELY